MFGYIPAVRSTKSLSAVQTGPCYIHWLGDKRSLPKITIRDKADNESKVVDKDGNQLDSKKDDTTSGGGTSGGGLHASRNVVYFDPCNGSSASSVTIDENGYAQPLKLRKGRLCVWRLVS